MRRFAPSLWASFLFLVMAQPAAATPVDFGLPVNRDILVEIEDTSCPDTDLECGAQAVFASDPGAIFAFLEDRDMNGRNGRVVFDDPDNLGNPTIFIDAQDWEGVLVGLFGEAMDVDMNGMYEPNTGDTSGAILGTYSDYRIAFDADGNVTDLGWDGLFIVPTFFFQLDLFTAYTPGNDGFYYTTIVGNTLAISCNFTSLPAEPPSCATTRRDPVAYDPATGTFTSHASTSQSPFPLTDPVFAPADFRLSEVPEPGMLTLLGSGLLLLGLRRR